MIDDLNGIYITEHKTYEKWCRKKTDSPKLLAEKLANYFKNRKFLVLKALPYL